MWLRNRFPILTPIEMVTVQFRSVITITAATFTPPCRRGVDF